MFNLRESESTLLPEYLQKAASCVPGSHHGKNVERLLRHSFLVAKCAYIACRRRRTGSWIVRAAPKFDAAGVFDRGKTKIRGRTWKEHMQQLVGKCLDGNVMSDWRDASSYGWLDALPAAGWAWEFLRRSPDYRASFEQFSEGHQTSVGRTSAWGLLRLEDPNLNALIANVFWQNDVSRQILPLTVGLNGKENKTEFLDPSKLACRTTILQRPTEGGQEVLFTQQGRTLQLSISGDVPLLQALLLTPVLPPREHCRARLMAVRRLTDLMVHASLRPSLYPRERRSRRLIQVLQALDGWLEKANQREIATAVFGEDRVARDWHSPGNHLRDQVRRAIASGRSLMSDRYRGFLK